MFGSIFLIDDQNYHTSKARESNSLTAVRMRAADSCSMAATFGWRVRSDDVGEDGRDVDLPRVADYTALGLWHHDT
jgi:hypothetical protein